MAMKLEDLDNLIIDISRRSGSKYNERAAAAFNAPDDVLIRSLGPLTNKMTKKSTIGTAVALNYLLGSRQPGLEPLRTAADQISKKIQQSANYAGAGAVDGAISLINANDASQILEATEAVKKALPDVSQDDMYAKMVDATLATALTFVPFVGPILSAACMKGLSGMLAEGGSAATGYLSGEEGFNLKKVEGYNADIKAGTNVESGWKTTAANAPKNIAGGISLPKRQDSPSKPKGPPNITDGIDWTTDTPGQAIFKALRNYQDADNKKNLENLQNDPAAKQQWQAKFDRIMNPLGQNQVALNLIGDGFKFKIQSDTFVAAESELGDCLAKPSKTASEYAVKASNALKKASKVLKEIINASIVGSFEDELDDYKKIMMKGMGSYKPYYQYSKKDHDHLSLIILAYYINVSIKTNLQQDSFYKAFLDAGLADLINLTRSGSQNFTKISSLSDNESEMFIDGRDKFKAATSRVLTEYNESSKRLSEVASLAKDEAIGYIEHIKNAMTKGITKSLFRYPDNKLSQIVITYAACNVIVNAVVKSALSGKMNKGFKIPYVAVAALANPDWGFVTVYSTWNKKIDDAKKIEKIGARIVNGNIDWNPTGARLRWYNDRFGTASESEQMMMYVFAKGAIAQMNLFNLYTGAESWEKTKLKLHEYISIVNEACHKEEARGALRRR